MGEIFGGRYELVDPLGRGGSGDVWRVWDHRRSQYLAGKVLQQSDSASLLRFVRETGWRFDHPHIVAPLGWIGEDDRVMFAMPLVHGGPVSSLLSDRGPLPKAYVAMVADQILDALEVVHGAGLVHRDLKPANILMEPTHTGLPDARLADFGIAAKVGEPRMTRVAEVVGTPGFMSPEAQMGADPDPAQDIYALGVVMIQLLTGNRPSADTPPPLPDNLLNSSLGRFVSGCLIDAGHRFPGATEARAALGPILAAMPPARISVPDRTPALPPRWGPAGPNTSTLPLPDPDRPGTPISGPSAPSARMAARSPGSLQPGQGAPVQRPGPAIARPNPWAARINPQSARGLMQGAPINQQMVRPAPQGVRPAPQAIRPSPPAARPAPLVGPRGYSQNTPQSGARQSGSRPVVNPQTGRSPVAPRDIVLGAGIAAGIALVVILVLLLSM